MISSCNNPITKSCVLEHDHEGYCEAIEVLILEAYDALEAHHTQETEKLIAKNQALKEKIGSLFEKIKHGDQEYMDWLQQAINEHFDLAKEKS